MGCGSSSAVPRDGSRPTSKRPKGSTSSRTDKSSERKGHENAEAHPEWWTECCTRDVFLIWMRADEGRVLWGLVRGAEREGAAAAEGAADIDGSGYALEELVLWKRAEAGNAARRAARGKRQTREDQVCFAPRVANSSHGASLVGVAGVNERAHGSAERPH